MQVSVEEWNGKTIKAIALAIYRACLAFYPITFRDRFGIEMLVIFEEAYEEYAVKGLRDLLNFLLREFISAPKNILNQHLEAKSNWIKPYPLNIMVSSLGFILLGCTVSSPRISGQAGLLFYIICLLAIGGTNGLAIGIHQVPRRKKQFISCGAIGFLCSNTLVWWFYCRIFPDAYLAPAYGIKFFIPFLFPVLSGCVYGFFIGIAFGKWHNIIRWVFWGGLGMLAGFTLNRLSAALMQNFLMHNPIQSISYTGVSEWVVYIIIPYLMEGLILGVIFGSMARRGMLIKA